MKPWEIDSVVDSIAKPGPCAPGCSRLWVVGSLDFTCLSSSKTRFCFLYSPLYDTSVAQTVNMLASRPMTMPLAQALRARPAPRILQQTRGIKFQSTPRRMSPVPVRSIGTLKAIDEQFTDWWITERGAQRYVSIKRCTEKGGRLLTHS